MSDPNKIREAVEACSDVIHATAADAALAYADSLEDPIWWCFTHNSCHHGGGECDWVQVWSRIGDCDIARATRPRRIE